ncbi:MAG: hypothetical protein ACTHJH_11960, partial [Marmoricola sp.]
MPAPSRTRTERLLGALITPGADPRPFQLAFLVPVAVDAVFRLVRAFPDALGWVAVTGWALIAVATLGAFSTLSTPARRGLVIALADMAALGVLRLTAG